MKLHQQSVRKGGGLEVMWIDYEAFWKVFVSNNAIKMKEFVGENNLSAN